MVAQCGRKQRTLFQFPDQNSKPINKLTLPAVRGLRAQWQEDATLLTWQPAECPSDKAPLSLLGYHIYCFTKGRFASKRPITTNPIVQTHFTDIANANKRAQSCYMIRAVFSAHDQVIQGPASYIATAKTP